MDRRMFRGKRTDTGDWVYGYYVPGHFQDTNFLWVRQDGNYRYTGWCCVDLATIGQCTGLPAAKSYRGESEYDRMIFEGDKIRLVFRDGEVETYVVCWDKERLRFVLGEIETGIKWGFDNTNNYEIIGTIFDAERAGSDGRT